MAEKSAAEMAAELEAEMLEDGASMRALMKTADDEEGVDLEAGGKGEEEEGEEQTEDDGVDKTQADKEAQAEADKQAADKKVADDAAAVAAKEATDKKAAEDTAQAAKAKTDDVSGVEGPNGKTIPYAVLKGERQRAHDLEESNKALKAELETLKAKAGGDPAKPAATDDVDLDPDEFDPKLVAVVNSLKAKIASNEKVINEYQERDAVAKRTAEDRAADEVAAEIEANASLKAWRAEGGDNWKQAVAFDQVLRNSPAWANKPMSERFAKVAAMTADALGLPPPTSAAPKTPAVPPKTPDTKPAGKPKAKEAAVTSISDLAGGGDASLDSHDELENSTAAQLAVRMQGMNRGELGKYIRETG